MANVLTDLIPDAFAAARVVSREAVGYIPAVDSTLSSIPLALGEGIRMPFAPVATSTAIVPAMVLTEPADQTITNKKLVLTDSESATFAYTGEEQKGLMSGSGHLTIQGKQIAQAMRTLTNKIELNLSAAALLGSRAFGTGGTTPFASDLTDIGEIKKMLIDNGAPTGDLQLVMDTTAGAKLYGLTQLTNVNEAGNGDFLRQGMIGVQPLNQMMLRQSGASQSVAIHGNTGTVTVTSANAIGATTINLTTATSSGVVQTAGQYITFAGDTNKYLITADVTIGASTTGNVIIAAPGLLIATSGSEAVSGNAAFTANTAFDRSAIQLLTAIPAMPVEGDARIDSTIIQDPHSGLAFELSVWAGQRKVKYEVAISWGSLAIDTAHIHTLLG